MSETTNHHDRVQRFFDDVVEYFSDLALPDSTDDISTPLDELTSYVNEAKEAIDSLNQELSSVPTPPDMEGVGTAIDGLETQPASDRYHETIAKVIAHLYSDTDFASWYSLWDHWGGISELRLHAIDMAIALEDAMQRLGFEWGVTDHLQRDATIAEWVKEVVDRELAITQPTLDNERRDLLTQEAKLWILKVRASRHHADLQEDDKVTRLVSFDFEMTSFVGVKAPEGTDPETLTDQALALFAERIANDDSEVELFQVFNPADGGITLAENLSPREEG